MGPESFSEALPERRALRRRARRGLKEEGVKGLHQAGSHGLGRLEAQFGLLYTTGLMSIIH